MADDKTIGDAWVRRAQEAMSQSTTYLDNNYRSQLEKNLALFQSRHPAGSKYNTETYKLRSKLFRPKTRTAVRKMEAAADSAFFSNEDVVSIQAENGNDKMQQASAEIMKELLQYRLTKTIPWYTTVIGGCQDAMVQGVVCSYQYWKYREKRHKVKIPMADPATGQPILDEGGNPIVIETEQVEVVEDKPCVELTPLENVRFHPGADWQDPVNSSPYLIRLFPMYAQDIREQMKAVDPKTGAPKWNTYTDAEIQAAVSNQFDSTRIARQPTRQDAQGNAVGSAIGDYTMIWVQEHIHRIGGRDMVWYMLGETLRLSDPKPLKDVYLSGKRPLVMGMIVIETHKPLPASPVELGQDLQVEANEIANQRIDNVKFVLNKRWIASRSGRVDVRSLTRNVPGGVTLADNPETDVKEVNWPDVTSSAYAEQDRVNVDYDDLVGNFSQSSVATNRKLNETVGGMSMLLSGANQMTEYGLRVLSKTWIEPVLRQLTTLEQHYETDTVVLSLAAERANLFQKYGVDAITDQLLQQELTIKVNVGMGATNPQMKLGRFIAGMDSLAKIAAAPPPGADMVEIGKEIFGLLGYEDGARFGFGKKEGDEDPRLAQAMQLVAQLQQAIESKQVEKQAEGQVDMQIETVKQQAETERESMRLLAERETELLLEAEKRKTRIMEIQAENQRAKSQQTIDAATALHTSGTERETAQLSAKVTALEERNKSLEQLLAETRALIKEYKEGKDDDKGKEDKEPAVTVIDSSVAKPLADLGKAVESLAKPKKERKTIKITLPSGKTATGVVE